MRAEARKTHGGNEFKGHNLGEYKAGVMVVVNENGKWQMKELVHVSPVNDNTLEVEVVGGQKLRVNEAPRIVEFGKSNLITDSKRGGDIIIEKPYINENGSIEYDITTPDGKKYKGIAQEFLVSWKNALKLEKQVGVMERQITDLSKDAQKDFKTKVKNAKKLVSDIFGNLPKNEKEMTRQSGRDVTAAVTKIEKLHQEAQKHLADLEFKISEAHIKEGFKKTKSISHAETAEDKNLRKNQEEESADFKTKKAKSIKDYLAKQLEQDKEEALVDKKKNVRKEYEDKLADWENEKRAAVQPEPKQPNYKNIRLEAAEENTIRQDYDKRVAQSSEKMQHDIAVEINNFLDGEFKNRRTEKLDEALEAKRKSTGNAKADLTPSQVKTVEKDLRTALVGEAVNNFSGLKNALEQKRKAMAAREADPKAAGVDPATGDYLSTRQEEINARLYDSLIKDWKKQYDIFKKDIEQEETEELNKAVENKREEAYKKFLADSAEWDIKKSKIKKKPDEPSESSIALTRDEERQVAIKSKFDAVKYLADQNSDLKFALAKKRMERAKIDPDKEHVVALLNGGLDYDGEKKDEVNAELLDEVLADWEKAYEFKEKEAEPDAEVFDFNNAVKELAAEFDTLASDQFIPKDNDIPKSAYKKIYKDILEYKTFFDATADSLKNIAAARKAKIIAPADGQEELNKARESFVANVRKDIDNLYNELENIAGQESAGEQFEKKEKRLPIDLSSDLVERLLISDISKTKEAMKVLYRGNAVDQFKALIGDQPPAWISEEDLRKAGIKDWADFKELWDKELAAEVAGSMEAMAKQSILRKVSEAMDSLSGAWKKVKATAGQLTLRASLNGILIGGSAMTLRALLGESSKLIADAAVFAGGAASGSVKWWVGSKVFGKDSWFDKRGEKSLGKIQAQTADELIEKLVEENISGQRPAQPQEKSGFFAKLFGLQKLTAEQKQFLEGMPMISGVIAQTIREKTAGEIEAGGFTLKGSQRLAYERALARLETQNPEEEQVKQLASVFFQMSRKGDELQQNIQSVPQASAIDKFLQHYSGRGSLGKSIAFNTALSGIFLASGTARAAFGVAMGGYTGYKAGERMYIKGEQKEIKAKLADRLRDFNEMIQFPNRLDAQGRKKFKSELIYFKKFLHGNAPQEDLLAAINISGAGAEVDELLLSQIENLVYEAERTGILAEKEEDTMNLEKVLAAMREYQGKVSEKDKKKITERFGKWLKKSAYKFAGAMAGGAVGGAAYYAAGHLVRPAVSGIRNFLGLGGAGGAAAGVSRESGISTEEGANSSPLSDTEHAETIPSAKIDPVRAFAVEHKLTEESYNYLKQFEGLEKHPDSLNRILESSHVGADERSHFTGSKIDNLIEAGGERRAVIFEELIKYDKAAATKFLEEQHLGKQHLAYLSEYVGKDKNIDFADFVKNYDSSDKKMSYALFRAMQGKENSELANAGFVRAATEDHAGRTVRLKGDVVYLGLDKDGKPILSGNGEVLVKETFIQRNLPIENVKEGFVDSEAAKFSDEERMRATASTLRYLESEPLYEGDATNDYAGVKNPKELGQLVETELDKASFARMGEDHTDAIRKPISGGNENFDKYNISYDKNGNPIETLVETGSASRVSTGELINPYPETKVQTKTFVGKTVARYEASGEVVAAETSKGGSVSESVSKVTSPVVDAQATPATETVEADVEAAQTLTAEQKKLWEQANIIYGRIRDELPDKMSDFDFKGNGESIVTSEIKNEPLFKNFESYFEKASNGQAVTEAGNLREITKLLESYDSGRNNWYNSLNGEELKLLLDPNPDNNGILANSSHAVRFQNRETGEDIFFADKNNTFNLTGGRLLEEIDSRGKVVATYDYIKDHDKLLTRVNK